ncbi:MAG: recombinase family protein [Clostridia bacterium]|nr:recombinase family protein [Clostridia bacterium]
MPYFTAVAYARYSSDKQQESSITVQIGAIRKFCASHKIHLLNEYIDEAQTGTNANRKEFQQMIVDAKQRQFQFVIVHRMDRWARNVDDARYYKKYLAKYGIKIISAIEEFDETPEGEFFELMSMGMAELYSKKLAREAAAGKIANAREGKVHGGTPLLGYKVKNKRYVIEEKETEAVKIIFDMAAKGIGYEKIRDYLNANGYRHSDGRLFTACLHDILTNRKYIGEYVYNRSVSKDIDGKRNNHKNKPESEIIRLKDGIPRIIDDRTFYKVQEIIKQRAKTHSFPRENRKRLLSGIIRCGICGRAVSGSSYTGRFKIRYHSYKCNSKGQCDCKSINADYLEDYIYDLILNCLFAPENLSNLEELIKLAYIKSYENLQKKQDGFDTEIRELKSYIQSSAERLKADEAKAIQKYIENEIASMKWQLQEVEHNKQMLLEQISLYPKFSIRIIKNKIKRIKERMIDRDFTELQKVYNELIQAVVIDNDNVEIRFKMQTLLDSFEPITVSIFEKRDNIARPENHHKITYTFSQLTVKVG